MSFKVYYAMAVDPGFMYIEPKDAQLRNILKKLFGDVLDDLDVLYRCNSIMTTSTFPLRLPNS